MTISIYQDNVRVQARQVEEQLHDLKRIHEMEVYTNQDKVPQRKEDQELKGVSLMREQFETGEGSEENKEIWVE